jgi:hypothetical protein
VEDSGKLPKPKSHFALQHEKKISAQQNNSSAIAEGGAAQGLQ